MARPETKYIVIHCSQTRPSQKDVDAKWIARVHRERGWLRIGYGKVIKRNGEVEQGRGDDDIQAHVKGYNHCSYGLVLVGGAKEENWKDYYYLTHNIIDAAVLWKENSYIPKTFMCVSFQFRKHLALGRGGIILTDNKQAALDLKKLTYDGRHPDIPWREQNIETMGYHYYMTPETDELGLKKLSRAINNKPIQWTINDWPDVSKMKVFDTNESIDPYLQTK